MTPKRLRTGNEIWVKAKVSVASTKDGRVAAVVQCQSEAGDDQYYTRHQHWFSLDDIRSAKTKDDE